ncbi:hypothetical protein D3C87_1534920 [compost metagenome]
MAQQNRTIIGGDQGLGVHDEVGDQIGLDRRAEQHGEIGRGVRHCATGLQLAHDVIDFGFDGGRQFGLELASQLDIGAHADRRQQDQTADARIVGRRPLGDQGAF